MAGEGRHRGRRWIVLTILAILVALPLYVLLSGTCLFIVTNDVGADANVTVFLGPQPVGASRVANGESAWYVFTPHTQDDFVVGCRKDSLSGNRLAHVRYGSGAARIFRVTLGPCGQVKRHSRSGML